MTRDWHATFLDDRVTMAAAQRHAAETGEDGWATAVALAGRIEPDLTNWDAIGAAAVIAPRRTREKADTDQWEWSRQFSHTSSELPPVANWTPVDPADVPRPQNATYGEYAQRYERPVTATPAEPLSRAETGCVCGACQLYRARIAGAALRTQQQIADVFEIPLDILALPPQAEESFGQNRRRIEQQLGCFYQSDESRPVRIYHVTNPDTYDLTLRYLRNRHTMMQQFIQEWMPDFMLVAEDTVTEGVPIGEFRTQLKAILTAAHNQTRVDQLPADLFTGEGGREAVRCNLIRMDPPGIRDRRIRLTPLGERTHAKLSRRNENDQH